MLIQKQNYIYVSWRISESSQPQPHQINDLFFTVIIRKISGTSSVVAIRTCHVAILEQSQITPRMLRIPTVQTEKLHWSYAKCFCLCLFTRNCRWICNSFPGLSRAKMALHNIPLNFLCEEWLSGLFSSRSVFKMIRSFHVLVDNWTWLVDEELN